MIVTRRAPWSGWRLGDDPTALPQFEPGKRECIAKLALEKHGESFLPTLSCALSFVSPGVRDIQFVTAHMISSIYQLYLVEMFVVYAQFVNIT